MIFGRSQDFVWINEEDYDQLNMTAFRFHIGVTDFNTPADLVKVYNDIFIN